MTRVPLLIVTAGISIGSLKMLVIDVRGLRDSKRRRGFVLGRDAGVPSFSHSDSKLRGFLTVSTQSVEMLGASPHPYPSSLMGHRGGD
jgi:hypothetical protein